MSKSKLFFKELKQLLDRNESSISYNPKDALEILKNWSFADNVNEKLSYQLEKYEKLPNLNGLINKKLEQLLPLYDHILETGRENSIFDHIQRFIKPSNNSHFNTNNTTTTTTIISTEPASIINKAPKLTNLKAHIIKYEIFDEYFRLSEFRKNEISILLNQDISEERIVHTYTDLKIIQFVRLLHDEIFLNSSYFNYYKRFSKLFFEVVNSNTNGFSKNLRPVDLEKLIQTLIYSNKKLKHEEQLELKIDEINRILLSDLQNCGLKLSNKEMFALLQLTFQNTKDINNITDLYDKFSQSDKFEKNEDFYRNFLNVNISLGFFNDRIMSKDFTKRIINDIIERNDEINVDRYLLKYLFKYSWIIKDVEMSKLVAWYILESYTLDNETFNMIVQGLHKYDSQVESPMLGTLITVNNKLNKMIMVNKTNKTNKTTRTPTISNASGAESEIERFNVRLLDHLLEKSRRVAPTSEANIPGISYKLPLNRYPQEVVKRGRTFNNYIYISSS